MTERFITRPPIKFLESVTAAAHLRPCHIDVLHLQGVFLRILTEKLWNYVILRSKSIVNPSKSYRIERHCIPLMDSMALYFDGLIRYPVSTVLEPIC